MALRRRNRDSIAGNNQWLVGKYFSATGIDGYFDPIHIVGAVRRIGAKCLNTSEVLYASALSMGDLSGRQGSHRNVRYDSTCSRA
ncbi:hypothetical protein [Nostoc sp.]|uniref:hypothetical protein n=1 Tax=Nostoc sp. TaxID=1180 RepID=UPI002FF704E9